MTTKLTCTECGRSLEIRDGAETEGMKCPSCGTSIAAMHENSTPPPNATAPDLTETARLRAPAPGNQAPPRPIQEFPRETARRPDDEADVIGSLGKGVWLPLVFASALLFVLLIVMLCIHLAKQVRKDPATAMQDPVEERLEEPVEEPVEDNETIAPEASADNETRLPEIDTQPENTPTNTPSTEEKPALPVGHAPSVPTGTAVAETLPNKPIPPPSTAKKITPIPPLPKEYSWDTLTQTLHLLFAHDADNKLLRSAFHRRPLTLRGTLTARDLEAARPTVTLTLPGRTMTLPEGLQVTLDRIRLHPMSAEVWDWNELPLDATIVCRTTLISGDRITPPVFEFVIEGNPPTPIVGIITYGADILQVDGVATVPPVDQPLMNAEAVLRTPLAQPARAREPKPEEIPAENSGRKTESAQTRIVAPQQKPVDVPPRATPLQVGRNVPTHPFVPPTGIAARITRRIRMQNSGDSKPQQINEIEKRIVIVRGIAPNSGWTKTSAFRLTDSSNHPARFLGSGFKCEDEATSDGAIYTFMDRVKADNEGSWIFLAYMLPTETDGPFTFHVGKQDFPVRILSQAEWLLMQLHDPGPALRKTAAITLRTIGEVKVDVFGELQKVHAKESDPEARQAIADTMRMWKRKTSETP